MNIVINAMNKDLILREKLALQRTILANQTTLLAFIRTAMYFLVAGVSIDRFLENKVLIYLSFLFYFVSFLIFILGWLNFLKQRKKIKESEIHVGDFKDEYLG